VGTLEVVLNLRRAMPADVVSIKALVDAAYGKYLPRLAGLRPGPMTTDYSAAVRDNDVWVATDDDAIMGLVVLIPQPDHLLLDNIAVSPAGQGRGVGTRLMGFVEERALALGFDEVRLYTHVTMTENLAYYPRRGYVETHRAEQNGFRRVFFSKRLRRDQ
jgi:ribosomal protein S18 acetylase RimI-like enzyme